MQESLAPGSPVLAFPAEVDMASAEEVRASLTPLIQAGGSIVIDLSAVTFMDTTGVHALLQAAEALAGRGCLIVQGANAQVTRLLAIAGMRSARPNIHIIDPL
jgi:anti-sigma B factor antagonist